MAHRKPPRALHHDREAADGKRGRALPARPLHALRARRNGAPLGGREAARRGAAVPRGLEAGTRLDDDGDARCAMAAQRRGRLRAGVAESEEVRIAVPSKGRLREPTIELLHDAGLGPETPGDRALAFPCRNAPVEGLLVRADDIPEYVQDGVVDCGVTGMDIVRERGADVIELAKLGFGACSLEAAVPHESHVTAIDHLAGARVATSFPRLAQQLLPD